MIVKKLQVLYLYVNKTFAIRNCPDKDKKKEKKSIGHMITYDI